MKNARKLAFLALQPSKLTFGCRVCRCGLQTERNDRCKGLSYRVTRARVELDDLSMSAGRCGPTFVPPSRIRPSSSAMGWIDLDDLHPAIGCNRISTRP
jgi:hypothetical protein